MPTKHSLRQVIISINVQKDAAGMRVVSFDVGETLVTHYYLDYVWNEVVPQLYAKKAGIGFKEAKDHVRKKYNRIGVDDVRWYSPEYWFNRFNLDEDPLEVFRSHTDKIRFYPEVPGVLESLRQEYELIVASGIPTNIVEIMLERIKHLFKHLFSPLSDLNEVKKTTDFYLLICKTLVTTPSAMVHVGDDWYYDFIIPRKIGIKSFLLDRTGKKNGEFVIKDLKKLEELLTM